jgi:hypothetical protein
LSPAAVKTLGNRSLGRGWAATKLGELFGHEKK